MQQPHPAFTLKRKQAIAALNLEVEEYEHKATGATHYHLAADNTENVFLVALRTVPEDSTGVAHILEHTALCGSKKYPVRDPFFMMIRRSLNTFMNAFTSSDWTAYPFASQNRKDFQNLLEVYLDAVFFSRLDPLDFAQEGHRIEFADPKDPNSDLVFKGVVFNEMKGAMSSVPSQLWQALCKHLFPTVTYHHNSGGDPEHIPDLSYEQLVNFYRSHYHPSNAIFMTYGDISAAEHQEQFEELALKEFSALDEHIAVENEQRFQQPVRVQEFYPYSPEDDGSDNKHHVVMGWLLGESTDLETSLEAQLLSNVLLDNSSSPLQQVLETTKLGNSPSPLCGLEDSMKELVFACGLEGCNGDSIDDIEKLILSTLQRVAEQGVPVADVEAMLNQLELSQREVSGDGYPYGLHLVLTALGSATHRGDPIGVLDLEPALNAIRKKVHNPDYIKNLVKQLLLDNPHRVLLQLSPDETLSEKRSTAEKERLAAIKQSLTDAQKQEVINQAAALAARQEQVEDESILPKVGLADIGEGLPDIDHDIGKIGPLNTTWYSRGTNGLVYQQLVLRTPALPDELVALLPYYSSVLTEVGLGNSDYLQTQTRQAAVCGSINAFNSFRGGANNIQDFMAYFAISAKALQRFQREQAELIRDTLTGARFDEHSRLGELLAQQRAHAENSITGNGHSYAMQAASSGISPIANLTHRLSGLAGIQTLKQRHDASKETSGLSAYADQLQELHHHFQNADKQLLVIGEEEIRESLFSDNRELWHDLDGQTEAAIQLPQLSQQVRQCWVITADVNFCAKAYPTVPLAHPDSAALTVLGGFLRNGYLHRAIREKGGAYGGGASQDSNSGAFRFYSYRDPRTLETLDDFDGSLDWLATADHKEEQLEQAILGVISSLDKPGSPAGEAKRDFQNRLFGRTKEIRDGFRERVVNVSIDDLKRVAAQYLKPEQASIAVISSQSTYDSNKSAFDSLGCELLKV